MKFLMITIAVSAVLWTAAFIWEQWNYDPSAPLDWDNDEFFDL